MCKKFHEQVVKDVRLWQQLIVFIQQLHMIYLMEGSDSEVQIRSCKQMLIVCPFTISYKSQCQCILQGQKLFPNTVESQLTTGSNSNRLQLTQKKNWEEKFFWNK